MYKPARGMAAPLALGTCALLAACPGLPGMGGPSGAPTLGGGSLGAAARQGPLRTKVLSARITERATSAFLFKAEAEVEVADAAGTPVAGLPARFFRFYLSPMPESTTGALPVPSLAPPSYSYPSPSPTAAPLPQATSVPKYRTQIGAGDMQQLPALTGEIDSLEDLGEGRYKAQITFKSPPRTSGSYSLPSDWKVSLAALIADDAEAARVSNWDQVAQAGMPMVASPVPGSYYGTPGPAPTFLGFPADARLTGSVGYGLYGKGIGTPVGYRSASGATASVAAIPDYFGNFYFRSVPAGQYQFILDAALARAYAPVGATPVPDVPLPLPTYPAPASPSARGATPGPAPAPNMAPPIYYGSANSPMLYVSDPVTAPATPSQGPQVAIDLNSLPGIFGTSFIRTSSEHFANFTVGYAPDVTPLPAEFRVEISDASGSVVSSTATSAASPVYWNLRDGAGNALPAGVYSSQLVYWKRGGSYGGANFFGRSAPQRIIMY
ncbi:MAG: hypothetical protein FJZ01_20755 [Candidatus Sericytochromatia bacterium]|nr:hypothetical protein [Candidatus Tanganyikabacteria bacterium]